MEEIVGGECNEQKRTNDSTSGDIGSHSIDSHVVIVRGEPRAPARRAGARGASEVERFPSLYWGGHRGLLGGNAEEPRKSKVNRSASLEDCTHKKQINYEYV